MSKAVAKKEETAVSVVTPHQGHEEILRTDIVIPRLLLMQGLSDLVNERKAQQGDLMRSTTAEKLGDPNHPVEIIPLTFQNQWRVLEILPNQTKPRFVRMEPRNAKNEDLPWDFVENAAKMRRVKVVNLFALLPSDIEAEAKAIEEFQRTKAMPDLNATLLPVLISFQSTSYNAGKAVVTHFAKAASMAKFGAKPYGYTLKLSCFADKNEKGQFYVLDVAQGAPVSPEYLAKAEEWYQVVTTAAVKVDESGAEEEVISQTVPKAAPGPARY